MKRELESIKLSARGMTCPSCELKIENALRKIEGVKEVKASLAKSAVTVKFDPALLNIEKIKETIFKLGYEIESNNKDDVPKDDKKKSLNQLIGAGIIIFALYMIIKSTVGFNFIPQVDKSVGYGMLFIVGFLTSLHCIAMCGGINISQCVSNKPLENNDNELKFSKFKPIFFYNSGRVISYTIIGGIVGTIGSVVSFSGAGKGIVAIAGGVFMIIIGINMLDIFPWLRKIKISTPKFFGNKIYNNAGKHGPFYIGLLNGLMPCGPLQTMQLYALGTGSFLAGATSMFLFSLGTVPLMFIFGAVSSLLSRKFTHRMLKVSAVLVVVLGLTMVNRGLSLSGVSLAAAAVPISTSSGNVAKIEGNVQVVTTKLESGRYQPFTVQKGIPVRWIIKAAAEDLNGCNNPLTIPKYNIQKKLVPGDNVIEFTPTEEGNITYTCWMGMISSNIKVVNDLSKTSPGDNLSENSDDQDLSGGSCCAASAKATKFYGGKIPIDDLQIAKIKGGIQEAYIKVNDEGYSPAVVILQKGIKAKIKFITEKLNSCNNI